MLSKTFKHYVGDECSENKEVTQDVNGVTTNISPAIASQ